MTRTAIIYNRVSSLEQRKGFGLERQRTYAVEYAEKQGWTVEAIITDEGRSAFHGVNRLEGAALHQFELEARNGLHRGKILLVEHIDRLSRQGAKAAAQLIWGLNEQGVDVATFQDRSLYEAGKNSDMLDLFKVIINAQAAHEASAEKSNRGKANWVKRRQRIQSGDRSTPAGKVPAWLAKGEKGYELIPHRAAILNEIFDLYIAGNGIHMIATILNDRQEPTWRKGAHHNGWFYSYIHRLLTRRSVIGEYIDSAGNTLATDFYPEAVTAEKFARAQAILQLRKPNQKTDNSRIVSVLSRMVTCAECGRGAAYEDKGRDSFQTYTAKSGEVRHYARKWYKRLRCDSARRKHQCSNQTILDYDVVEQTILQEYLPMLVERDTQNSGLQAIKEKIAETERQRDINETGLRNIADTLADTPSRILAEKLASLESEIDAQVEAIKQLKREHDNLATQPSNLDDIALIETLRGELQSADPAIANPARRKVNLALRRLIKGIEINPDGTWAVRPDDQSWWLFDETGKLLEGAYVP